MEMNLKIMLISTMGRKSLIESAPGTLGRRVIIEKFSLEMSSLPRAKSLRMRRIRCFSIGQKDLKKATGKPSGPGVVSILV
jgi:hypothetical protein